MAGAAALVAGVAHAAPAVAVAAGQLPAGPSRLAGSRLRLTASPFTGSPFTGSPGTGSPGTGRPGTGRAGSVALTFDDGPSPAATPAVLDALDRLGLRATFFVLGEAVAAAPWLAGEIARRGHEVACHGMRHVHHLLRSPGAVLADTAAAVDQLAGLGLRPRFYRPPYGQVSAATLVGARRAGCEVVLWSAWGREFAETAPGPVLRRLVRGLRPGAVVLLHDSDAHSPAGTAERTLAVLPGLAAALDRRGLEGGPLGELLE